MVAKDELKPCLQKKKECFAYEDKKCKALSDTKFNYECPFYKTKEQWEKETNEAY